MRYVDNRGITDARVNLALDEYLVRHAYRGDDLLLCYVNAPAVIIGKHQNAIEEINQAFVRNRGIPVVRRISGGGAVYHDLGNLNFSIITGYRAARFNRYDDFTRPVIEVLRGLGVPAELGGRSDIVAGGRKLSGNAQFVGRGCLLSHGTLLVDANLADLAAALDSGPDQIESKAIKSIRSRVANISEFLDVPVTPNTLRDLILERVFEDLARMPRLELSSRDWQRVEDLALTRYGSWEWNFGESPRFELQRARRYPAGELDIRLAVNRGGNIDAVDFGGDLLGRADLAAIERALTGVRYRRADIASALDAVAMERPGRVAVADLVDLLHA